MMQEGRRRQDPRDGILIVTASAPLAEDLRRVLARHGHSARLAQGAREAIEAIRERRPSLVLTEVSLSGMDGYELCRWVRGHRRLRDVGVMLLAGPGQPAAETQGLECGADGLITDLNDEARLLQSVEGVISSRSRAGRSAVGGKRQGAAAVHGHADSGDRRQVLKLLHGAYQAVLGKNVDLCQDHGNLSALSQQLERRLAEGNAALESELAARQEAEDQLRHAREKYRSILDNSVFGICLIDPDLHLLESNRRIREWFPRLKEDAACHCYEVLCDSPAGEPCPDCPVRETLRDGQVHEILRRDRRGGEPVTLRVASSAVRDTAGNVLAATVMVDDLTRLTRLEEQLGQAAKLEAIGLLAGGIAHDFNNLLVVINGCARMIADSLGDASPLRKDADQVLAAGQRAANLTRQLLAFSRRQNLEPVVLNINRLTESTSELLQRIIGEDIELECILAPDLGNVRADRAQLEQVLMNLAVNARDAMPNGGRLIIQTANVDLSEDYADKHGHVKPGPHVVLIVSDTGCGIRQEVKDRIFEPFFTTKEPGKGTGLGLAMVYGTVRQHGGNIYVYSEPGRGATFKVFLLRIADEEAAEPQTARQPQLRGTETILLVEDEDDVRSLAERILAQYGYRILTASGAEQAREAFRKNGDNVALLLTDVVMPSCDGPALFRELQALSPLLRVLYVSGYTESMYVRNECRDPDAGFLQKPFSPETLASKVRDVLDASHSGIF